MSVQEGFMRFVSLKIKKELDIYGKMDKKRSICINWILQGV